MSENVNYMLTTVDNPFNPFTQFDEWFAYDRLLGHNTSAFLARIARLSDGLSEADEDLALQQAIDEIVDENVSGMFRKVREPQPKS